MVKTLKPTNNRNTRRNNKYISNQDIQSQRKQLKGKQIITGLMVQEATQKKEIQDNLNNASQLHIIIRNSANDYINKPTQYTKNIWSTTCETLINQTNNFEKLNYDSSLLLMQCISQIKTQHNHYLIPTTCYPKLQMPYITYQQYILNLIENIWHKPIPISILSNMQFITKYKSYLGAFIYNNINPYNLLTLLYMLLNNDTNPIEDTLFPHSLQSIWDKHQIIIPESIMELIFHEIKTTDCPFVIIFLLKNMKTIPLKNLLQIGKFIEENQLDSTEDEHKYILSVIRKKIKELKKNSIEFYTLEEWQKWQEKMQLMKNAKKQNTREEKNPADPLNAQKNSGNQNEEENLDNQNEEENPASPNNEDNQNEEENSDDQLDDIIKLLEYLNK